MWDKLSEPWKICFELAWEAYCNGSVPIGAVLTDETGMIIGRGRSMQFEKTGEPGQVVWSKLSHAEVNALLQVSAHDHPNIRGCTLYTTMEPCPLCIGALVMSNVRNLCFAASDTIAGSVNLLVANEFNVSKQIHVSGPIEGLEIVSVLLHTAFYMRYAGPGPHTETVLNTWEKVCPAGIRLGRQWFIEGWLDNAKSQNRGIGSIMDEISRTFSEDNHYLTTQEVK